MIAPRNIDELSAHGGQEVGASRWQAVTQDDVNRFAEATPDHQWIHTDVARARQTEFGGTIAHGFYTLSLAPKLLAELVSFEHLALAMNYYGLNRAGGASLAATLTFEIAGGDKPVCVAEFLVHLQA